MNHLSERTSRPHTFRFAIVAMAVLCIAALFVPTLSAQTAASAGAIIGNQASATYNDASGVQRTSFSNLVQTTVSQVYLATLAQSQTRYATVGTQVVFPHTYTNNGNGTDTVVLTLGTPSSANFSNPAIYMDANGDGVPDNTTNIAGTTYTLAPGQVLKVVLVGTLGTGAGATEYDTIIATPGHGTASGSPNTDTITKTVNAAISVTKAMSASSGVGGNTVGVTLTYTNTGNATSGAVVIADPLGSTTTAFAYAAGSAKWNGTALNDSGTGLPAGVTSYTITGNTPTITLASVAPGVTGTFTFNVTVGASAPIGGTINNTANFNYNDGGSTAVPTANTNTVPFTIQQTAKVYWTAGDGASFTATNPNGVDALGAKTVAQGGTIVWTDTLTNEGNGTDVFNISYNGSTFPAGTTFQFYRADGVTPLTDSNGDGIVDVGPVSALGTATVIVKATLPTATTTGASWSVNVVAASTASTASGYPYTATDQDTVNVTITAFSVDLTITASANTGAEPGKGSGVSSAYTTSVNPGVQVVFPFYVQNTTTASGTADAYTLSVQSYTTNGNVTVPAIGTPLPAGFTAIFHQASGASCPAAYAAQASPVTSTPALTAAAGANAAASYQLFCLELDTPAAAAVGSDNFIITALSTATGAEDQMTFQVVINQLNLVTITPNQSGQVYAGGTIVYKHVITNAGNSAANVTVTIPANAVVFNPNLSGWSGTLYQDAQTSGALAGVLDPADTLLIPGTSTVTLAPVGQAGSSVVVFLKVQSSPGANPGDNTDAVITITYNGSVTATTDDMTTVVTGQLKLVKSQSVITHTGTGPYVCSTTPGAWSTLPQSAYSHDCVFYQIVATNTGSTNVTNPSISDAAPPYTTPYAGYNSGVPSFSSSCSLTGLTPAVPSFGAPGNTFTGTYATGSMTPGCTITVIFEVQLN